MGVGVPVVPDSGGECEEFGGDAGVDAFDGSSAVVFEAELAFEGVEDGFDPLADPPKRPKRGFSSLRSGRTSVAPRSSVMNRSKSRPAKPLSPRMTVSLDMPHGTGVESRRRRISCQDGVSRARAVMAAAMSGPAARTLLL